MRQEIKIPGGILVTEDPRVKLILKKSKVQKVVPEPPVRKEVKV